MGTRKPSAVILYWFFESADPMGVMDFRNSDDPREYLQTAMKTKDTIQTYFTFYLRLIRVICTISSNRLSKLIYITLNGIIRISQENLLFFVSLISKIVVQDVVSIVLFILFKAFTLCWSMLIDARKNRSPSAFPRRRYHDTWIAEFLGAFRKTAASCRASPSRSSNLCTSVSMLSNCAVPTNTESSISRTSCP